MLSKISIDEKSGQLKIDPEVVNFGEEEQSSFAMKMHNSCSNAR